MQERELGQNILPKKLQSLRLTFAPTLAALALTAAACGFAAEKKPEEPQPLDTRVIPTISDLTAVEPTATLTVTPEPLSNQIENKPEDLKIARIGEKAPDFSLENLDGETVSLSDFSGKPVIIFYYGYKCPPCDSDLEKMADIAARYKDQDLVVLTIAISANDAMGIGDKISPILIDDLNRETEFNKNYRMTLRGVPSAFFISRDGILALIRSGVRTEQGLENDVLAIISGQELVGQGKIDRSLLNLPEPPTYTFLKDLPEVGDYWLEGNPWIPSDDVTFVLNLLAEVKQLAEESEETNIGQILEKLALAGKTLASDYCVNYEATVLEFLVILADTTFSRVDFYTREGILESTVWRQVAANLNPQCEVRYQ